MRRWTLLVLLLSSCGKEPEAPKAPTATSTPEPTPEAAPTGNPEPPALRAGPRPAPSPPPIAPWISLTANGSDEPEIPKGTPILLELWLNAPPERSLTIHAVGGSWSSFVQLEAPGPPWTFRPAMNVGPMIKLDAANAAVFVWTLPAKTVDSLPRGEHAIRVKLDTRQGAAPDSWVGHVHPPPIKVRLTSEPASPPRIDLLVRCALWERSNDEALRLVENELAGNADSPQLLALKAEALEASGRPKEALQALDEAVATATRLGTPSNLYAALRAALRRRMAPAPSGK
jgi:hypothetical protein